MSLKNIKVKFKDLLSFSLCDNPFSPLSLFNDNIFYIGKSGKLSLPMNDISKTNYIVFDVPNDENSLDTRPKLLNKFKWTINFVKQTNLSN